MNEGRQWKMSKIILWQKYFWTKKSYFCWRSFFDFGAVLFFVNWRPVSIFSHRVAQISCSPSNIFLVDTSTIKFPNALWMKAANEKCEKSFCDINIFERKKSYLCWFWSCIIFRELKIRQYFESWRYTDFMHPKQHIFGRYK